MAETGQRVGDYEVLAPLGAGGMGRVYKVRNVISNREEAMKILLPDFASDPDLAARFMAEIRTLAGLEHPGIAQLRTAFQHQNQFVMVMEYVEGTTLEKLAAQMRSPLDHIVDYSMQVLAALSYAHGRGVTHRDIKPANIMITTHGVIKLMDFGIAKSTGDMQLTRPGSTMGSVYYMSPEQVRGGTVDGRTDLYSFGVTLYEMLTGRKPFQADTSYSVLNAQLNQAPTPPLEVNPAISPELNSIVLRAMAKAPEDRFQTADQFRDALKSLCESQPAQAAAPVAQSVVSAPAPVAQPPQYNPAPAYGSQTQYGTAQAPPFTPVPPAPGPPPRSGSSHRGLWIGLGAATALLALIAVAALLPRIFSTNASQKPAAVATDTSPATPSTSPASSTPAQTRPADQPTSTQDASQQPPTTKPAGGQIKPKPKPSPGGDGGSGRPPYVRPGGDTSPAGQLANGGSSDTGTSATPPSGPSPRDVRDAHDRYANLEARADAALAGVEQIRSQQQAQGLDIRGDILAAMNRLHHQLDQAHQALSGGDLDTASEYMNRADADTTKLEKFLGR